jgi:ATP-binding cassette subfamily A (ABC1) protein 3
MVNGQLKCLGSPQHLKNKFGEGFTVIVKIRWPDDGTPPDLGPFTQFFESHFPGSVLKDVHQGLVHYHVTNPNEKLSHLFGSIQKAKEQFRIEDYCVSQTTLEQVFINFARAQVPPQEEEAGCLAKCQACCLCCCCKPSKTSAEDMTALSV